VKILFVAKCDYSGLAEGMCRAFASLGHETGIFDTAKYRRQDKYRSPATSAGKLSARLSAFRPDVVFVVAPLFLRLALFEPLADYRQAHGTKVLGWIGDQVADTEDNAKRLSVLDKTYYTDTGFADQLSGVESAYLPLATDPEVFSPGKGKKTVSCSFVAAPTDNRVAFLARAKSPVSVFGPDWKRVPDKKALARHKVRSGAISLKKTAKVYRNSRMVLNLKNGNNVVRGLNQRSFDPCACQSLLLHDLVEDLALHFDVGAEVLAFSTPEDFDELCGRAEKDPGLCARVAESGCKRVLAHHTFRNRAEQVQKDLG